MEEGREASARGGQDLRPHHCGRSGAQPATNSPAKPLHQAPINYENQAVGYVVRCPRAAKNPLRALTLNSSSAQCFWKLGFNNQPLGDCPADSGKPGKNAWLDVAADPHTLGVH